VDASTYLCLLRALYFFRTANDNSAPILTGYDVVWEPLGASPPVRMVDRREKNKGDRIGDPLFAE
jgi:hypothetical protein